MTRVGGVALALGSGAAVVALLQPRWLTRALARRFPEVLFRVETAAPLVAITIDDGPDLETTPLVLDALARHGARATFFLLGTAAREPRLRGVLERIAAQGHELGNHLLRDEPAVRLPPREFERQLLLTHEVLRAHGEPRFFRPGSGWFSAPMLRTLRRHGYTCALGSVYPFDAHHAVTAYSRHLVGARAGAGDVVVLHDRGARGRRTAAVLDAALGRLRRRGYTPCALRDLAAAGAARPS